MAFSDPALVAHRRPADSRPGHSPARDGSPVGALRTALRRLAATWKARR